MTDVKACLYDSEGSDREITLDEIDIDSVSDKQLLWINVLKRDEELLEQVTSKLRLKNVPFQKVVAASGRPDLDGFEGFFRFSIDSAVTLKNLPPERLKVDFLVGKNFVVTVHEDEVEYFTEFRDRENGETKFGELDAEVFVATLIDLNIISYFHAIDELERQVDKLDQKILKADLQPEEFLDEMIQLRKSVSKLRRWLTPHRKVLYALARADLRQVAESGSAKHYKRLTEHFESAVEAVESSRETVLGVFDLYATKAAQLTNLFIKRLTFLTLITGSLGVIAGALGMNYKAPFFDHPLGFWITVGGMILVAIGLTGIARLRRWI